MLLIFSFFYYLSFKLLFVFYKVLLQSTQITNYFRRIFVSKIIKDVVQFFFLLMFWKSFWNLCCKGHEWLLILKLLISQFERSLSLLICLKWGFGGGNHYIYTLLGIVFFLFYLLYWLLKMLQNFLSCSLYFQRFSIC